MVLNFSKLAIAGALAALAVSPALAQDGDGASARDGDRGSSEQGSGGKRVDVTPYIEAGQVLSAELSPGSDSVTYSRIAAGVDALVQGRNTAAAVSLRYERRIGWGNDAPDGDELTGIARASASVIPRTLTIEAGGLATRTRIEGNGGASGDPLGDDDQIGKIYSIYGGPSLSTYAGDVAVQANYRIGYTRVDEPNAILTADGGEPVDVFDDSTVHVANIHMGTRPGQFLPVGLGVGAGWYREDMSNLDQRIEDKHVRADVTVPVSQSVALVGGVGYEEVKISSRDALRDEFGVPVRGSDGRLVTDKSEPRQLAYDVDGLIWDVGVIWRPSVRTTLEAHVGRRYGSTTYYGSFGWQASRRSSVNIAVYDNVVGFGGNLNNALTSLPTDFTAVRDALSGGIGNCVESLESGSCFGNALGSVRSGTFRGRGVMWSYAVNMGRTSAGIGAGYDRRKFIAAEGTVLAAADGVIDENWWLGAYVNNRLDQRSTISANAHINWLDSGFDNAGKATAFGVNVAYDRVLAERLTATAALGLDGINRSSDEDLLVASALLGVRYSF